MKRERERGTSQENWRLRNCDRIPPTVHHQGKVIRFLPACLASLGSSSNTPQEICELRRSEAQLLGCQALIVGAIAHDHVGKGLGI